MGENINDEVCEICAEEIGYCLCWRCMVCESLYAEGDGDYAEDDDGEAVCGDCQLAI